MGIISAFNVLARESRQATTKEMLEFDKLIKLTLQRADSKGLGQQTLKSATTKGLQLDSEVAEIKRSSALISSCTHFVISKLFTPKSYCGPDAAYEIQKELIASCNFDENSSVMNGDICTNHDDIFLEFDFDKPLAMIASAICMYFRLVQYRHRDNPSDCLWIYKNITAVLNGDAPAEDIHSQETEKSINEFKTLFGIYIYLCEKIAEKRLSPYWRVRDVFSANAAKSIASHQKAYINKMCLGVEFSKEVVCIDDVMLELYNSPLVDKTSPKDSRFFSCLTDPGRPMHGVFSVSDLESILLWVSSGGEILKEDDTEKEIVSMINEWSSEAALLFASTPREQSGAVNQRNLYTKLINSDIGDDTAIEARAVLLSNFSRASDYLLSETCKQELSPFDFSPKDMLTRMDVIHHAQEEIGAFLAAIDICHNTLKQIHTAASPIMPVDGVWLEFLAHSCFANTFNRDLFAIYMDEVGSCIPRHNHAKIWSVMVSELGLNLPPFLSSEFSAEPSIPDPSFTMANCMMGFSLHGREFFPELLGFNLSIELAGLGGTYTAIAKSMEEKGLPSEFWRVHASVDNAITGHTFLSARSIDRFMRSAENMSSSKDTINHFWRRIWSGFVAHRLIDEDITASYG